MTKNLPIKPSELGLKAIDWSKNEVLAEVKNFIGTDIPDPTFTAFVGLCKHAGLNPFLREAWCLKIGDKWQIMTGINGYMKFANSHPEYDNYDEPEFEMDPRDSTKPLKCTIRVWRKDRTRPVTAPLYYKEAKGPGPRWNNQANEMLEKSALAKALRRSFSELHGTYTEDEITVEQGKVIDHGQRETRKEKFSRQLFEAGQEAKGYPTGSPVISVEAGQGNESTVRTESVDVNEPVGMVADPLARATEYTDRKTGQVVLMYEDFCYNIQKVGRGDKLTVIHDYLDGSKAFFDDKYLVWRSKTVLPKLANYLVDEPVIHARGEQQELV